MAPLDIAQELVATVPRAHIGPGRRCGCRGTMQTSADPNDAVPETAIPASGRGNSEHGTSWLNPSPNQLYRALMRKDKAIELEDAPAVAHVHEMYVSTPRPNPRLARTPSKACSGAVLAHPNHISSTRGDSLGPGGPQTESRQ